MTVRRRYIAHWSTMPGAFAEADSLFAATSIARSQARYISPEAKWAITDRYDGGNVVATSESDSVAFFAAR